MVSLMICGVFWMSVHCRVFGAGFWKGVHVQVTGKSTFENSQSGGLTLIGLGSWIVASLGP